MGTTESTIGAVFEDLATDLADGLDAAFDTRGSTAGRGSGF